MLWYGLQQSLLSHEKTNYTQKYYWRCAYQVKGAESENADRNELWRQSRAVKKPCGRVQKNRISKERGLKIFSK